MIACRYIGQKQKCHLGGLNETKWNSGFKKNVGTESKWKSWGKRCCIFLKASQQALQQHLTLSDNHWSEARLKHAVLQATSTPGTSWNTKPQRAKQDVYAL